VKLRRKRYVIDPDQLDHPLVRQHDALLEREAALGVELAAWARHADSRLGGQYVTGLPRAFRTSATLSRVMRERKRLEARLVREGVMILGPGSEEA
jgi:aryl-alcohol dehydrogenase-like predicted oxidoreductase